MAVAKFHGAALVDDLLLQDLEFELSACVATVAGEVFGSDAEAVLGPGGAGTFLLSLLVRKLQMALDILVEAERAELGVHVSDGCVGVMVSSKSGRLFERPYRGRDRRRPFFFDGLAFNQR